MIHKKSATTFSKRHYSQQAGSRRSTMLNSDRSQRKGGDLESLDSADRAEKLNLFGRPTYTKNQAKNQKNLENFAEKISHLDTLENCENTLYRLVPNLPNDKSARQMGNDAVSSGTSPTSPSRQKFSNTFNSTLNSQSQMNFNGNESLS